MVDRLSSSQEDALRGLLDAHGCGKEVETGFDRELRELADEGHLVDFKAYIGGTCAFRVGGRARAYFEELDREEESRKQSSRHDWALNLVNGVYLILGAVLGVVAGVVATMLATG